VVALVADLMDQSKVRSALPETQFARSVSAEALGETLAGADVVIVDLARYAAAIADVRRAAPSARIVAFGPHVDTDAADQAANDGADVVLARSRFFRDVAAAVTDRAM
jgi:hypothetical protein